MPISNRIGTKSSEIVFFKLEASSSFFLQLSLDLLLNGPLDLSNKVGAVHDSPIIHLTPLTALQHFLVAIAEDERIVENCTKPI